MTGRVMKRALVLCAGLALWAAPAMQLLAQTSTQVPAEGPVSLVADSVRINGDDTLIAEGRVEILQGARRLTARRVIYDDKTQKIQIEGPLVLHENGTRIEANAASLNRDLSAGLIRTARVILAENVQIAAAEIARVDTRYTQFSRAVATSCKICNDGRAPIWQIRARELVQDTQERQLYFRGAQLRILDVPILYLPRLRLPDPSVKRARGFLLPKIRNTSELGTGIKIPYFIPIGSDRDLTLTPYLARGTRTLEWRYRQAFRNGSISFEGAFSRDRVRDDMRSYLFGSGEFDLARGYKLTFDAEATSDKTYLLQYDYSKKDRLDSQIALTRTRRSEYVLARLTHFETLRDSEDNSTLPPIALDLQIERYVYPSSIGGRVRLAAGLHGHYRYSETDQIGRDVMRLTSAVAWDRQWTTAQGLRLNTFAGIDADLYSVAQDSTYDSSFGRVTPTIGADLRWPLARYTPQGATHILEPVVQLLWRKTYGDTPPNEDSIRAELDEGNLLAWSRYPGQDRRETGLRAVLGMTYTRIDPTGWETRLTFARSLRQDRDPDFSETSGLRGASSDWLVGIDVALGSGLRILNRTHLNTNFDPTKSESQISWQTGEMDLSATYAWLQSDPSEGRSTAVSEWHLDTRYRLARHWTGAVKWRYDFVTARSSSATLGLEYRNECVEVDVSVSRRFTSSTNLEPSTSFGLSINLTGFQSGGRSDSYVRSCRK